MTRRGWLRAIWCVLIALTLAFIWSNSLRRASASKAQSDRVTEVVRPVADPQRKIPDETFDQYVRKTAHLLEFAFLGFAFAGLGSSTPRMRRWLVVLLPVVCACVDEFLQSLSDRAASVWDVLLDTAGIFVGIGFFLLCNFLIRKIRGKERPC